MNRDALFSKAEALWADLRRKRPDLSDAIDLQRSLIRRNLELSTELDRQRPPYHVPSIETQSNRLGNGEPVMLDVSIEFDSVALRPFLFGYCEDLADGGAGNPATRVRTALERGEVDIPSLLTASLRRQQTAIRTRAQHISISPDLLWLVAELCVGPVANHLQNELLAERTTDPIILGALRKWSHGYCPACGSWPALEESQSSTVQLRCSFCGLGWHFDQQGCIYCGEQGDSFVSASTDVKETGRRVDFCRACHGYVKCIETKASTPFELLPVIELATSDLDAFAFERGYNRPSMREIETNVLPCPPQ